MTELYVSEGALARACDAVGVSVSSLAAGRYRNALYAAAPVIISDDLFWLLRQGPQWNGRAYRELEARARELLIPGVVCLPVAGDAARELEKVAKQLQGQASVASRAGQMAELTALEVRVREVARSLRW